MIIHSFIQEFSLICHPAVGNVSSMTTDKAKGAFRKKGSSHQLLYLYLCVKCCVSLIVIS